MEWIVVDNSVIDGVQVIELKCPNCGFKETHTRNIGKTRSCYVCGELLTVREDCQQMSSV